MIRLSALLCFLSFGQTTYAQIRGPVIIYGGDDQDKCEQAVEAIKKKTKVQDDAYAICRWNSDKLLRYQNEIPACIEQLLKLTSIRNGLVSKCLSSTLRKAIQPKGEAEGCLIDSLPMNLGEAQLTLCMDKKSRTLIKDPKFLVCVERYSIAFPSYSQNQVINYCRFPYDMENLSSQRFENCSERLQSAGISLSASYAFCVARHNQDQYQQDKLLECSAEVMPFLDQELAINYCLSNIYRYQKLDRTSRSCLAESFSFLSPDYLSVEKTNGDVGYFVDRLINGCFGWAYKPEYKREKKKEESLKFHKAKIFAHDTPYGNTSLGGLSGLAFNASSKVLHAVSDDQGFRGRSRFYEFNVELDDKKLGLQFKSVQLLKTDGVDAPPYAMISDIDAEGIAITPDGLTILSTETLLNDSESFLKVYNKKNEQVGEILLSEKFTPKTETIEREEKYYVYPSYQKSPLPQSDKKPDGKPENKGEVKPVTPPRPVEQVRKYTVTQQTLGILQNKGFEALCLSADGQRLYTANESPLIQDTLKSKALVRIVQLEKNGQEFQTAHEYAYELEHEEDNGLVDMVSLSENRLLVLERAYRRFNNKVTAKIFLVNLDDAVDYKDVLSFKEESSQAAIKSLSKKFMIDLESVLPHFPSGLDKIDNLEGMTLGPRLPSGEQTLILVSDNNFNSRQKTQFIVLKFIDQK